MARERTGESNRRRERTTGDRGVPAPCEKDGEQNNCCQLAGSAKDVIRCRAHAEKHRNDGRDMETSRVDRNQAQRLSSSRGAGSQSDTRVMGGRLI